MNDTCNYLLSDVRKSIEGKHLYEALTSLHGAAVCLKNTLLAEEVEQVTSSYNMLLDYYAKGVEDPERSKLYLRFNRQCIELTEKVSRAVELATSNHYATTHHTLQRLLGEPLSLLSADSLPSLDYRDLFDLIYTSDLLQMAEHEMLASYFWHEDDLLERKCLVASALTLSSLKYFDPHKLRLLTDLSEHQEDSLKVRGLVGVVFVCSCHASKLDYYPDIVAHLEQLLGQTTWRQNLELLQLQLFLTLDTKRIDNRINKEIMPKMMEQLKGMQKDREFTLDDLTPDLLDSDINPEWKTKAQETMNDLLTEFMGLQAKGADLYMSTFKNLKQRFPFFNHAANWFYPFTFNHPAIPKTCKTNPMIAVMLKANVLCDSDKYSLCLMSEFMTNGINLNGLEASIPVETKATIEEDKEQIRKAEFSNESISEQIRSYVQGFYRFSNLFTFHVNFVNPFTHNLLIGEIHPFESMLDNIDHVTHLADSVFEDHAYSLALHLYEKVPANRLSPELLQKMGFCHESMKQYEEAVDCYNQSLLSLPEHIWTLRRLVICLRHLRKYAEAELHLVELEQLQPENTDVALWLAECFMHEKLYDEAFKRLFKVDYLNPGLIKVKRALAWCSLLTGKYEQAEKYYAGILDDAQSRTANDLLNAGHVAWLTGNTPEAVARYVQATCKMDNAYQFLDADKDLLLQGGKSETDLTMMADAVGRIAHADSTDKSKNA